ncbi:MAG: nucleotidyltransferase domain-containing protein [Candidatus Altiarchaeota archaeon]
MRNTGRDKILEAFQRNPKEMYLSEIAKQAEISLERAHTYLKEMTRSGYLTEEKKGNMSFYKPNFNNELLIKELEFIELKRKQTFMDRNVVVGKLVGRLVEMLQEKVSGLEGAFLFGSVARGEHNEKSDIDILVVCKTKKEEQRILEAASKTGLQYGREVNASVVDEKEFGQGIEEKTGFYKTLLRDRIIFYGEKWFYTKYGDKIG